MLQRSGWARTRLCWAHSTVWLLLLPNLSLLPLLHISCSHPAIFPISWTNCFLLGLEPSRFYFPASPQNYSDESITSFCRDQGPTPSLVTIKLALHSSYLFTLFPIATSEWLCKEQCPSPPGCEYMWLINCCWSHLPSVVEKKIYINIYILIIFYSLYIFIIIIIIPIYQKQKLRQWEAY